MADALNKPFLTNMGNYATKEIRNQNNFMVNNILNDFVGILYYTRTHRKSWTIDFSLRDGEYCTCKNSRGAK